MIEKELDNSKIAVMGLGNIGLPLAIELGKKYTTVGFDLESQRILSLKQGIDSRNAHSPTFTISEKLIFSTEISSLHDCNIYIVAVPTSTYNDGKPNLQALLAVTQTISSLLKKNDLVIYESTVFPGCTENICVPILELYSGLKFNNDFFVGYSPERINTADSLHTLSNTIKITAGSTPVTAQKVDQLYKSIVLAGTFPVKSIKVAEAAKLVENAQRDINIAFMNDVANILSTNEVPFDEVWDASSTKWNFLKFTPGLVGGDCLPLASQYLDYLSDGTTNTLSTARHINENVPYAIAKLVETKLKQNFGELTDFNVLILGVAYKPNTSSIKGSLVPTLIEALQTSRLNTDVYDPVAEPSEILMLSKISDEKKYHLIIRATNHQVFEDLDYSSIGHDNFLNFDIHQFRFK
ncbi:nucleotide sugar dehydrogenase [Emticicia sp. SJ17W-69]|uniref:nucleotide sugar dehydrogenase n=1 Tax=Emticicia sp. SJ17W-69 TaxID=3421657 RepID=UPI003EB9E367